ncbi:MAG: AAA family ATPase [Phycisphaeraceae bacterium]
MSQTLAQIAQQLKDSDKKVQLIYAFNGSGKTRLSREFKELVAPKQVAADDQEDGQPARNKILYYNAFTEDLFYWDNDLDGDVARKLRIQPNTYTEWALVEQGQDRNAIGHFQRYTDDKLTPKFNEAYKITDQDGTERTIPAFSEVTFSFERGDDQKTDNVKISKGEESNFIWSIFYAVLEQVIGVLNVAEPAEREANQFDALEYIFIDDPVSSLDENHLIQLAVDLSALIKSSQSGLKFIISTHSTLFYNVLFSELKPSEGYILRRTDKAGFEFEAKRGDSNTSFSYHLHIKRLIERAVEERAVQRYHFNLLRNLYEKAASFLGYQQWSDLLPGDKAAYAKRIMHFYSHRSLSNEEIAEPTDEEKQMVKFLVEHLASQYRFWQPEVVNA